MANKQLSQDEIDNRRELLAIYRRSLAHLLQQAAYHGGEAHAPIAVMNGLHDTRQNIHHIKQSLRDFGVAVDDLPDEQVPPTTSTTEPQSSEPAAGEPPFKGLHYFAEQDSANFFGREQLTERLSQRVYQNQLIAVIGASGSGKSSLVRAGLIPSIRQARYAPSQAAQQHWQILLLTPGAHPNTQLANSLTQQSNSVLDTAQLIDAMHKEARSATLAAMRLLDQHEPKAQQRLLLVIDQFEEIFTLCHDPQERSSFIDNLLALQQDQRIVLVLVLRADFFNEAAQIAALRQPIEDKQILVGPMDEQELRRAIEEPARRNNWQFEPGLVDLLLREVAKGNGSLPLLAHALLAIWQKRQGRLMTLKAYAEIGGMRGALMQTADSVYYQQLTPSQQPIARNIFLRLLALSDVVQITRRRASLSELISSAGSEPQVEQVLQMLTNARLITTSNDTAEVAHEALIEEWPTLHQWLAEERDSILIHNRLADATNDWLRLERNPDLLYRGSHLAKVLDWLKTEQRSISLNERAFLDASSAAQQAHDQQQAEQSKRQQRSEQQVQAAQRSANYSKIAIGVVLAVFVVSLVGWFVYLQTLKYQARQASPLIQFAAGSAIVGNDPPFLDQAALARQELTLPAFAIEAYEVTNQQYQRCMQAGACADPPSDQRYFRDPAFAQAPVVFVSAYQAQNYCTWLDRRLPSMYEWERAARGTTGRIWPWGEQAPNPQTANLFDPNATNSQLRAVGSLAAGSSPEGVFDLIGNAWEWTSTGCQGDTCASAWNGTDNILLWLRGGAYDALLTHSAEAINSTASTSDQSFGFRCAQ
jgi:formylglycine-generating enzyme required for sulfatase activity/archaellum biogenesis ATPase FlaH